MIDKNFWKRRKVFITGHTGFKGSWLCMWLHLLESEITGYALDPPTNPSLFELAKIYRFVDSKIDDIRDGERIKDALLKAKPEIVFSHGCPTPCSRFL